MRTQLEITTKLGKVEKSAIHLNDSTTWDKQNELPFNKAKVLILPFFNSESAFAVVAQITIIFSAQHWMFYILTKAKNHSDFFNETSCGIFMAILINYLRGYIASEVKTKTKLLNY